MIICDAVCGCKVWDKEVQFNTINLNLEKHLTWDFLCGHLYPHECAQIYITDYIISPEAFWCHIIYTLSKAYLALLSGYILRFSLLACFLAPDNELFFFLSF